MIALHIDFRSAGIRWPLGDDDRVEVWDARTSHLFFVITGELLKTVLRHHFDALAIQAMLKQEMDAAPRAQVHEAPMPAANPAGPRLKDLRRMQRRARGPAKKALVILALSAALAGAAAGTLLYDESPEELFTAEV